MFYVLKFRLCFACFMLKVLFSSPFGFAMDIRKGILVSSFAAHNLAHFHLSLWFVTLFIVGGYGQLL